MIYERVGPEIYNTWNRIPRCDRDLNQLIKFCQALPGNGRFYFGIGSDVIFFEEEKDAILYVLAKG
jgi:hypothetical protein